MKIIYQYLQLVGCVLVGTLLCVSSLSFAQNYRWESLGSVGVEWDLNGNATSNQNAGSIVIGGTSPDGTLQLDVGGGIGGSTYCNENGASCAEISAIKQWKYFLPGDALYTRDTATQVGIGTENPTQKLHVDDDILADAFLYSSDIHLKTNIQPLSGMDIISQLQGVRFDWIDTGESEVGVIAQQVEKVLPELVVTDETTGNKLVQYSNLVAPLIQAVNEQRIELQQIEKEIQEIQSNK